MEGITVVTGTVGHDSHVIGTRILSRFLKDNGFKVVELGALTMPDEFIKAAVETGAAAILISSYYGMGEFDLQGFREKCIEAGLTDILLYVGGYLAVGKQEFKHVEAKFKELGFDRVYPPGADLKKVLEDLVNDLKMKKKAR
ncbi:MAG: methylaspartate mutase subunit S [Candidatus Bathyarchaeia archaeon]